MDLEDNVNGQIDKERLGQVLSGLVKRAYEQERSAREIMIRKYKKLDLIANGSLYNVWDDMASDFRSIDQMSSSMLDELQIDPAMYNRSINVFRAWLESIVAALCIDLPHVQFSPESYSVYDDVLTAKAYEKISEKIDFDNDAMNKLVQCVWDIAKYGMFGIYNYVHEDKRYGIVKDKVYGTKKFQNETSVCVECGYVVSEKKSDFVEKTAEDTDGAPSSIADESHSSSFEQGTIDDVSLPINADPDSASEDSGVNELCPQCGLPLETEQQLSEPFEESAEVGEIDVPKRRVLMEIFSPLNIIVPQNAKSQKDIGFLICDTEIHEAHAKSLYPQIKDKIKGSSADETSYDRWARASTEFGGNYSDYVVTHRRFWTRPWYYEAIDEKDSDIVDYLKETYPLGCRAVFINNELAEIVAEDIDECWTLSFNPLANRLYDYSIGMAAMPIQEMFSEMANLILLCIQFGIPETFADPEFFSFEKYKKITSSAGLIFPAKMPPGGNLDNAFHSVKPAILPKDAVEFMNRLEQLGQLVTGAVPSIYGGPSIQGSRTAREYEKSISQALQRLSLTWKVCNSTWTFAKERACRMYKNAMRGDEVYSKNIGGDSYVDVWIKQSELSGKVGRAMPELTQELPVSYAARKQAVMELIQLNNETINIALFDPNNTTYIKNILGLKDLHVPGTDDRNKQLKEIAQLITQQPVPGMDQMTGQPIPQASVPIEPSVDNNEIHSSVCDAFLKSDVGMWLKESNQMAYQNVLLHKQEHDAIIAQQQMMQQQQQMQMENQQKESKYKEMKVSVPGDKNG